MKKKEIKKICTEAFLKYNRKRNTELEGLAWSEYHNIVDPLQQECGRSNHKWRFWKSGQIPFAPKKDSYVCIYCDVNKEDLVVY